MSLALVLVNRNLVNFNQSKARRFHAFSIFIPTGRLEPMSQELQAMKKQYIAPIISAIEVETGILCVSGLKSKAPNLESIGKSTGTW